MRVKILLLVLLSNLILLSQPNYQWTLKQSGSSLGGPIDYNKFNPNIVYYGSNNTIFKSTNRGESFFVTGAPVPNSSKIKCIILDDYNPGTFVVAIESSPNDKIYKTTDDGNTWILTNDEGQMSYFGIPITQDPSNPNTLFTMINTNFKKSTDFGSTWVTISSNFGPVNAPCDIEVFPDTNIILIGDNGTGIFKSTDYGLTWTQTFSTSGEIPTIAVDFTNLGIAWATKWGGGGGLLKSTDYG
ncbi:MAG: WD40/YVTN/BNR-like repeat-containing protein, partial [Ignavibacterium sp.]